MILDTCCGDPQKQPASSSRFVLPFAYKPERLKIKDVSGPHYVPIEQDAGNLWREKYLTHEIADVLFRRAKWFRLSGEGTTIEVQMEFRECKEGQGLKVCMASPTIVLFEMPKSEAWDKDNSLGRLLQTGFLIVDIYFPKQDESSPTLDTLLELNETFRYWQRPFDGHEDKKYPGRGYKNLLKEFPISIGANVRIGDMRTPEELYFNRWAGLLNFPAKVGNDFFRLFPEAWADNARNYVGKGLVKTLGEKTEYPESWIAYADNRTFVWTCAILEDGGNRLSDSFPSKEGHASEFGHWIKLLNIDNPGKTVLDTHRASEFDKQWAEKHTYKRWEQGGTFYGFSDHSGAILGAPIEEPPLWRHFREMYFDQILLLLYVRVTLFRFSMKLNEISALALNNKKDGQTAWRRHFQELRWYFALFTNLYQFPLLSNQQQAVEMYTLARKAMDVDALFEEIQKEITESHEYIAMREAKEQADSMERLTIVATIGLVFALAFSFWSMEIVAPELRKWTIKWSWWLLSFDYGHEWFLLFLSISVASMTLLAVILLIHIKIPRRAKK